MNTECDSSKGQLHIHHPKWNCLNIPETSDSAASQLTKTWKNKSRTEILSVEIHCEEWSSLRHTVQTGNVWIFKKFQRPVTACAGTAWMELINSSVATHLLLCACKHTASHFRASVMTNTWQKSEISALKCFQFVSYCCTLRVGECSANTSAFWVPSDNQHQWLFNSEVINICDPVHPIKLCLFL